MEIKKYTKKEYCTDLSREEIDELIEKYSIDEKCRLYSIDRNEWLTDEQIENYLQDYQDLWESTDSSFAMQKGMEIAEIIDKMEKEYNHPFTDDTRFALDEAISDRKTGDPLDDLAKNTPPTFFYYDTGYEIDPPEMLDENEKAINEQFLKDFGLSLEESKELLANAFYGGELVILFRETLEDFSDDIEQEDSVIEIKGGSVCIMDRLNGSGHHIITGKTIVLPYKKERLHCDEGAGGYGYSNEVCGLAGSAHNSDITIRGSDKEEEIMPFKE